MSNRAYASIWSRDFCEEMLIERWRDLLRAVPFSSARPGFTELVIRAVNAAEAPIFEQGLRSGEYDAQVLADLAREYAHSDCAYETRAFWDLWTWEELNGTWKLEPQPLEIICYGDDFDEGAAGEQGHFLVDLGFEHFFTGHAGLLGFARRRSEPVKHPDEASFVAVMSQPENLHAYQEKTQENIRKLYGWMERIEAAIPVERYRLWSEGEENFEARMDEILATR